MRFCIRNFGCKVNMYESEKIAFQLEQNGHVRVDEWKKADLFIINGCVVTHKSEKRNRRLIRKARRERPDLKIIVAGCLAERGDFPIEIVTVGNENKIEQILSIVNAEKRGVFSGFSDRNRSFLKIQDGCNQFCSYCIIPYVRGRERDMPVETVISEAEAMAHKGFQEVVLTGIHTGRNRNLIAIIRKMISIKGILRIRLSSIEVNEITDELIEIMKNEGKFMNHLHIPLQSGSDRILKAMNRPYDSRYFLDKVAYIRDKVPMAGITSDLIIGFPGEEEKDFQDSLEVMKQSDFHRTHMFTFSPRPGTAAWNMEGQATKEDAASRMYAAEKLMHDNLRRYSMEMNGRKSEVLVEDTTGNCSYGYSSEYLRTQVKGNYPMGTIIPVRFGEMGNEDIITGEYIES